MSYQQAVKSNHSAPIYYNPCLNNPLKTIGVVVFAILALLSLVLLIAGFTGAFQLGNLNWIFLGTSVLFTVIAGCLYFCPRGQARRMAEVIGSEEEILHGFN